MTRRTSMRTAAGGLAVVAIALPLAACGGSSKPAYCGAKDTLQNDIKGLPDQVKSQGIGSLQTNLKAIETDAQNLISSAKSDFPSETQAMNNSVNTLKASLKGLGSSPTPQELLVLLPQAQNVVSSVQAFDQAAKSKCD